MGAAEGGVSTPSAQSSRPPSTAVSAWPNSSTLKCNEPRIDGRATNSTLVAQKLGYWGNYQRGHTGDRGMLGYIGGLGFSKLGLMPALPYGCPRGVVASLGTLTDADKQMLDENTKKNEEVFGEWVKTKKEGGTLYGTRRKQTERERQMLITQALEKQVEVQQAAEQSFREWVQRKQQQEQQSFSRTINNFLRSPTRVPAQPKASPEEEVEAIRAREAAFDTRNGVGCMPRSFSEYHSRDGSLGSTGGRGAVGTGTGRSSLRSAPQGAGGGAAAAGPGGKGQTAKLPSLGQLVGMGGHRSGTNSPQKGAHAGSGAALPPVGSGHAQGPGGGAAAQPSPSPYLPPLSPSGSTGSRHGSHSQPPSGAHSPGGVVPASGPPPVRTTSDASRASQGPLQAGGSDGASRPGTAAEGSRPGTSSSTGGPRSHLTVPGASASMQASRMPAVPEPLAPALARTGSGTYSPPRSPAGGGRPPLPPHSPGGAGSQRGSGGSGSQAAPQGHASIEVLPTQAAAAGGPSGQQGLGATEPEAGGGGDGLGPEEEEEEVVGEEGGLSSGSHAHVTERISSLAAVPEGDLEGVAEEGSAAENVGAAAG